MLLIKIGRHPAFDINYAVNDGYRFSQYAAIRKPHLTCIKNYTVTLLRRNASPYGPKHDNEVVLASCNVPYADNDADALKGLKHALGLMAATQILIYMSVRGIIESDIQPMVELARVIDRQAESVTKQQVLDWISQ